MMSRLQALPAAGRVRRLIIVMLVAGMLPALWMDAAVAASIKEKNAEPLIADKVSHLNADIDYQFSGAALAALGDVDLVPLRDAGLIDDRQRYIVALHVILDLDALPVPMRVMGYFSSDWRLSSEWYTWPLR